MILLTGGAGFIGGNFAQSWLAHTEEPLLVLDALTYAGDLANLGPVQHDPRLQFVHGDIANTALVGELLRRYKPRALVHMAAESHVDRSILGPRAFLKTNVEGTFSLLEATRAYLNELPAALREAFRFLHVSTDEVFGSLAPHEAAFTEQSPSAPNSPYSASKAASDHLVRAWHHTYGVPTLTTHCSNNYGPYQYPEKLIPLAILNALADRAIPIYGDGAQVRDWLHVHDHCSALRAVLERGQPGQTYNIAGQGECTNLEVVTSLCALVDELRPSQGGPTARLMTHVRDRPGHDRRYAVNAGKLRAELNWAPEYSFAQGLRQTVAWYLAHRSWLAQVQAGAYAGWLAEPDHLPVSA